MKLTSNDALNMLEEIRKEAENDHWIDHSIISKNWDMMKNMPIFV